MSATAVQISNIALRSLGFKRITALTNEVESARVLNDLYTFIRDEMVSAHPWNFAIIYSDTLAENSDEPEFDYDYSYALPSDCLRVIELEDGSDEFKVVGGNLYTDTADPKIKYIAQITTPASFPPYFVTALAARLAAEAAYALTNSRTIQEQKFEEYKIKLQQAKTADAQEGSTEKQEDCSWINDRT